MIDTIIAESVGRLLDLAEVDACALLLDYAKDRHHEHGALATERPNLLGAVVRSYREGRWLAVVDLALVLDAFLDTRGYWEEDKENLELALRAVEHLGPAHQNRKPLLLHNAAVIYLAQGDRERARAYLEESAALQRRSGNSLGRARSLHYLGRLLASSEDYDRAREAYDASLALAETAGDDRGSAVTLHELGNLCLEQGAFGEAQRYYRRSMALSRRRAETRDTATSLHQLGLLNFRRKRFRRARVYLKAALRLRRLAAHLEGVAESLLALGQLACDSGDPTEASSCWQESLDVFERLGMPKAADVYSRLDRLMSHASATGVIRDSPMLQR